MSTYYKDTTEYKEIKKITIVSVLVNILLSVSKLYGGIIAGSSALFADGIHSFSDLATDMLLYVGVSFWMKPCDNTHPYGHRKIENIVTVFIGFFLLAAGIGIIYSSVSKISTGEANIPPCKEALYITIFAIIIKEILFRYSLLKGRELNSSAVIANAWHHRSDVFSSIPVLISLFISLFFERLEIMDKVGAVVVGFIILKVAFDSIFDSFKKLTDSSASEDTINSIINIATENQDVKEVHAIRTRYMGNRIALDMHVLVDKNITVYEGHEIAKKVKKQILNKLDIIEDVIIHIEPF